MEMYAKGSIRRGERSTGRGVRRKIQLNLERVGLRHLLSSSFFFFYSPLPASPPKNKTPTRRISSWTKREETESKRRYEKSRTRWFDQEVAPIHGVPGPRVGWLAPQLTFINTPDEHNRGASECFCCPPVSLDRAQTDCAHSACLRRPN